MLLRIIITGRSYHTAENVPDTLELADGATLDDALSALSAAMPEGQPLPSTCLIAVSGEHLGTLASHQPRPLKDGDELVLIAPVAGG